MWTPKQLLNDHVVKTLREAEFSDLLIEYLGWLNGIAQALNNSKNPVKAAMTILSKPKAEKMLAAFEKRKKDSLSAGEDAPNTDAFFGKFAKLQKWHDETEAMGKRYKPTAQDLEDHEAEHGYEN